MISVDLQNDPENDRMISDHILCMHRYRNPGEQDGEGMILFPWKGAFSADTGFREAADPVRNPL